MRNYLILVVTLFCFVVFSSPAISQTRTTTYKDKQGMTVGKTVQQGNTAKTYNKQGQYQGKAVSQGNTSKVYNKKG